MQRAGRVCHARCILSHPAYLRNYFIYSCISHQKATHCVGHSKTEILNAPSKQAAPGENISTPVKVGEVAKSRQARTHIRSGRGEDRNSGPRCIHDYKVN
jgi:hypothetical protein